MLLFYSGMRPLRAAREQGMAAASHGLQQSHGALSWRRGLVSRRASITRSAKATRSMPRRPEGGFLPVRRRVRQRRGHGRAEPSGRWIAGLNRLARRRQDSRLLDRQTGWQPRRLETVMDRQVGPSCISGLKPRASTASRIGTAKRPAPSWRRRHWQSCGQKAAWILKPYTDPSRGDPPIEIRISARRTALRPGHPSTPPATITPGGPSSASLATSRPKSGSCERDSAQASIQLANTGWFLRSLVEKR